MGSKKKVPRNKSERPRGREKQPRFSPEQTHRYSSRQLLENLFLSEEDYNPSSVVLPHPFIRNVSNDPTHLRAVQRQRDSDSHRYVYSFSEQFSPDEPIPPMDIENIPAFETITVDEFLVNLGNPEFTEMLQADPSLTRFLTEVSRFAATIDLLANGPELQHWLHLQRSVLIFTVFDLWRSKFPDVITELEETHLSTITIDQDTFVLQIGILTDALAGKFVTQFPGLSQTLGKATSTIQEEVAEYLLIEKLGDENISIPGYLFHNDPSTVSRILATRTAYEQAGLKSTTEEDYRYLTLGISADVPPYNLLEDGSLDTQLTVESPGIAKEYSNVLVLYQDEVLGKHFPLTMQQVEDYLTRVTGITDYHLRRLAFGRIKNNPEEWGIPSLPEMLQTPGRVWIKDDCMKGNFGIASRAVRDTRIQQLIPRLPTTIAPVLTYETVLAGGTTPFLEPTHEIQNGVIEYLQQFPPQSVSEIHQMLTMLGGLFNARLSEVRDILRTQLSFEDADFNTLVHELLTQNIHPLENIYLAFDVYDQGGNRLAEYSQRIPLVDFFQITDRPAQFFINRIEGLRMQAMTKGLVNPKVYGAIHFNHDQIAQEQITLKSQVSENWLTQSMYKASV